MSLTQEADDRHKFLLPESTQAAPANLNGSKKEPICAQTPDLNPLSNKSAPVAMPKWSRSVLQVQAGWVSHYITPIFIGSILYFFFVLFCVLYYILFNCYLTIEWKGIIAERMGRNYRVSKFHRWAGCLI